MMQYYTKTYDPRLNHRPPTLDEFVAADEDIWNGENGIINLINESNWSMEQAVYDMLHGRNDLDRLLGLRAVPVFVTPTGGGGAKGNRNPRNRLYFGNRNPRNRLCSEAFPIGKGKGEKKGKKGKKRRQRRQEGQDGRQKRSSRQELLAQSLAHQDQSGFCLPAISPQRM